MSKRNYGYKVCYREGGNRRYIRHFKTYTYTQAITALYGYIRYPPAELDRPKWKILPIRKREVKAGIWNEPPF